MATEEDCVKFLYMNCCNVICAEINMQMEEMNIQLCVYVVSVRRTNEVNRRLTKNHYGCRKKVTTYLAHYFFLVNLAIKYS